ncbi:MAG: ASCH domain-containing protein [Chloracidobacterium sp.]|nr:ASCH domain-containing protein [Chloracidobacterium sp.]
MTKSVSDQVKQFWADFCDLYSVDLDEPYQVWYFGNSAAMADELTALVLAGKKLATASLLKTNEIRPDDAPIVGGHSVVTDFHGEPKCVLQTTEIDHVRFCDVTAEFAALEGEGDLSLEYWRAVHRDYYEREAKQLGFAFDDQAIVCCEQFRLLYKR